MSATNERCAQLKYDKSKPPVLDTAKKIKKAIIKLLFECMAPDGKCQFPEMGCIDMDADEENGEVCVWLKAMRQIEP